MSKKKFQRAFTLMELMIVIVIIGILSAVGMVMFGCPQASPSVVHDWSFVVLRRVKVPRSIINTLRALCTGVVARIVLVGHVCPGYVVAQGMKQGCPLRGCLSPLPLTFAFGFL